jgi:carbonic anhydrase/acetyltransferase-like protein (isoleucine patch superfamily)
MTADARLISLPDVPAPRVAESAFLAPGAVLVGNVTLGDRASVWYNSVLRAEQEPITIGAGSNLQDNVSCHVDRGYPLILGAGVSVGHGAVLHGCTIEDNVLVGMAATVMNGAVIGTGSLVAAGAVVLEGTIVPPGSLVAGVPAKVRRELTDDEVAGIRHNAEAYLGHAALHQAALA